MQAFVKTERGPGAEIRTVPEPKPADDEVLIRVLASSICGTDVHIWVWNEWAQAHVSHVPMIPGHEVCGEVVEVGKRVRSLRVGDRVSAETHIVDGTCYQCRTGKMHICENVQVLGVHRNGVFAEFAVLPELNAWKNDPHLDPRSPPSRSRSGTPSIPSCPRRTSRTSPVGRSSSRDADRSGSSRSPSRGPSGPDGCSRPR